MAAATPLLTYLNSTNTFQLLNSASRYPVLNLMQRIEPLARDDVPHGAVLVLLVPLDTGTVEHIAVILHESLRQRPDMLAQHISRDPSLAVRPHGLTNRRHNLRLQNLVAHTYAIRVMVTLH